MAFCTIIAAVSLNVQTVFLFVGVLLLTILWKRHPRNLPPGPPAWPLNWATQHGSVMRIWLGPRLAIVLNDISAVKEALVKQADCFSDRVKLPREPDL